MEKPTFEIRLLFRRCGITITERKRKVLIISVICVPLSLCNNTVLVHVHNVHVL